MATATIIIIVLGVLLGAGAAGVLLARARRQAPATWIEQQTRRRLRVHTVDDGPTIEGLVETVDDDGLVLRFATFMGSGGVAYDLDGTAWVPRHRVLFVQRMGSSQPPT